jgi:hypothetical protein
LYAADGVDDGQEYWYCETSCVLFLLDEGQDEPFDGDTREETIEYFGRVVCAERGCTTINQNDIRRGVARNGRHGGSGHDVRIKRESDTVALAAIEWVPTGDDILRGYIDVKSDTDLQKLAEWLCRIPAEAACSPILPVDDDAEDSEEWSDATWVKRWNAI